jgi:hypothetical protein
MGSRADAETSLQPEVFLDTLNEAGSQLLLLSVHRQYRYVRTTSNGQMTTVTRFKGASLLLQPPLELGARHDVRREVTTVLL